MSEASTGDGGSLRKILPVINVTNEGDEMFNEVARRTSGVMSDADRACQMIWDGLHLRRGEVEDFEEAMRDVYAACAKIRREAREECHAVRKAYGLSHQQLSRASNDVTY